jgi:hypothetical protein
MNGARRDLDVVAGVTQDCARTAVPLIAEEF